MREGIHMLPMRRRRSNMGLQPHNSNRTGTDCSTDFFLPTEWGMLLKRPNRP
jgi:hypothetical protein